MTTRPAAPFFRGPMRVYLIQYYQPLGFETQTLVHEAVRGAAPRPDGHISAWLLPDCCLEMGWGGLYDTASWGP